MRRLAVDFAAAGYVTQMLFFLVLAVVVSSDARSCARILDGGGGNGLKSGSNYKKDILNLPGNWDSDIYGIGVKPMWREF